MPEVLDFTKLLPGIQEAVFKEKIGDCDMGWRLKE